MTKAKDTKDADPWLTGRKGTDPKDVLGSPAERRNALSPGTVVSIIRRVGWCGLMAGCRVSGLWALL